MPPFLSGFWNVLLPLQKTEKLTSFGGHLESGSVGIVSSSEKLLSPGVQLLGVSVIAGLRHAYFPLCGGSFTDASFPHASVIVWVPDCI